MAGALIVTTPQEVATLDARKALKMFEKVNVPVLGLIENMAQHVCSNCGHVEHLFGAGGGERMAAQYGVPLLGALPLDIAIREQGMGVSRWWPQRPIQPWQRPIAPSRSAWWKPCVRVHGSRPRSARPWCDPGGRSDGPVDGVIDQWPSFHRRR